MTAANQSDDHRLLVDAREASRLLSLSSATLARLTMPRGPIPALRIGTGKRPLLRYDIDVLKSFIKEQAAVMLTAKP